MGDESKKPEVNITGDGNVAGDGSSSQVVKQAVTLEGNASNLFIVTGHDSIVSLNQQGVFSFHLLNEKFRAEQQKRVPAAFYDGTRPNWANIAAEHDAVRQKYSDLHHFVQDPTLPAQRMALILGLAGEGKTTLLMRLAWDLAAAGYPVLWRHSGRAFVTSPHDFSRACELPLILCFDQVDQEESLPELVADLSEYGIPFIVLAAARFHEWRNAGLETALRRSMRLQTFALGRLDQSEVEFLLDKLSAASKLDALAGWSRTRQVRHFLDRLEADGQLLPALLTARYGATSFDAIVEDVLQKLKHRSDGELLLRAFILLSGVHRFGNGLSRSVLASALEITEAEVGPRILSPLISEMLEVTEAENDRLYTRHPLIADRAFSLAIVHHWVDSHFVYIALINAIAKELRRDSFRHYERRLLKSIALRMKHESVDLARTALQRIQEISTDDPVFWETWGVFARTVGHFEQARTFFKRAADLAPSRASIWQAWAVLESRLGHYDAARPLFQEGTRVLPTHAPTWQAWAVMEQRQGNLERARELFERGTQADPSHVYLWQAWALMEQQQGNIERARELFERGTQVDPTHAPSWQAWAVMEQRQGNIERARELFERGTQADPADAPTWQAWAVMESRQGNLERARELFERGTQADPSHAPVWQAWAVLEQRQGNLERARELFERSTQADPTHAPSWQAWALVEQRQGNLERARELFERGTRADPTHAPSWQAWAVMEQRQGNIERARELFECGTQADPTDAYGWQAWALLEQRQRNIDLARGLFERGTQADPTNAPVWQAWAVMEQRQGNIERARELFERGTQADPMNALIWQAWARMELEADPTVALVILGQALKMAYVDHDRAMLLCTRARALAASRRLSEAESTFLEALDMDELDSHTHYFYASLILEPQRRLKEAYLHYRRALELKPHTLKERQIIEQAILRLDCR